MITLDQVLVWLFLISMGQLLVIYLILRRNKTNDFIERAHGFKFGYLTHPHLTVTEFAQLSAIVAGNHSIKHNEKGRTVAEAALKCISLLVSRPSYEFEFKTVIYARFVEYYEAVMCSRKDFREAAVERIYPDAYRFLDLYYQGAYHAKTIPELK